MSVRHFDNWIGILMGRPPESCNMRGACAIQYVVEADGSVYPCDFYCLDEWKLGNVMQDDLAACDEKRRQLRFVERSLPAPQQCRECPWYALCRNGCPRDRVQEPGDPVAINYFCEAHREFSACTSGRCADRTAVCKITTQTVKIQKKPASGICRGRHFFHAQT